LGEEEAEEAAEGRGTEHAGEQEEELEVSVRGGTMQGRDGKVGRRTPLRKRVVRIVVDKMGVGGGTRCEEEGTARSHRTRRAARRARRRERRRTGRTWWLAEARGVRRESECPPPLQKFTAGCTRHRAVMDINPKH
jgi:hypothetical protein